MSGAWMAGAVVVSGALTAYSANKGAKASRKAAGVNSDASVESAWIYTQSAERIAALKANAEEKAAWALKEGTIEAAEISAAAYREYAQAYKEAAAEQLAYQQKGLDYLIQSEKLPLEYRDQALGLLGELYGTGPGQGNTADSFFDSPLSQRLDINQGELVEKAKNSPMYAAFMGTQAAGEESIMRNAAATGGLRSGNVQENLYDYNVQLGKDSLMQAYGLTLGEELTEQGNLLRMVSGVEGLAQYRGNAPAVASQYSAMGETAGGGILGAGQANLNAGLATAGGVQGAANAYGQGILGVADAQVGGIAGAANAYSGGILGGANARAGGIIGSANAWQQGAQNIGNIGLSALGTYYMQNPRLGTIGGAGYNSSNFANNLPGTQASWGGSYNL